MDQRPLVSVVVPVYNRGSTLPHCLKSILNQSFKDFELWIIDDGSTDNTAQVFHNFKDPRLKYFYQANQGVSVARNRGIGLALGDFIAFCDSDDFWEPKKLEAQLALLEKEKTLWVHSQEIWIRNQIRVNPHKKHAKPQGRIYLSCLPLCVVSPSSVVIHKNIFKQVGLFDPFLTMAEDYDLWLRIASQFEISLAPQFLITKTGGHQDQLSRTFIGMDKFRVRALKKQLFSPFLSLEEKKATKEMFLKKCHILAQGYQKHQRMIEAEFYFNLIRDFY